MSSFDVEIAVLAAQIGTPNKEALEAGTPPHVELGITQGLALPIPNPETGQPLVIPSGKFRFSFSREQAIEIFEAALRAAIDLPETFAPSGKVLVAQSMGDVDRAAQNIKRVTGQ